MSPHFKRFYVLDALRILLALSVAMGHAGVFPFFGPVTHSGAVADIMARGFRTLVFGPPAVIAFFLISGFCIHYPFVSSKSRCPFFRFYARRYIRILTPVLGTVALFKLFFPETVIIGPNSILWASTLWSIVCEEIYYALYPFLNRLFPQLGWPIVLTASFAAAAAVIVVGFPATDWQDVGIVGTSVTLFPIWLLGCYLAEQAASLSGSYSATQIWLWRFLAWVTMWLSLVLHFHSPFHQTLTGVFVGVVFYFWLRAEIAYYRDRSPWRFLIWGGGWSYSLYLIHPIVIQVLTQHDASLFDRRVGWIAGMALVLLSAYAFYLIVERPSHNLARKLPLTTDSPNDDPLLGRVKL
jgi:peptidoglycan/LPS O-acetylase OafA/YrhL